jgi:hypothetical protein
VTRLRARRPGRAARLAWMLPAAGTLLLVAALAWAAVSSAHHPAWLGGPPAWRVGEPTTVLTLEGPATAAAGDWVVQGAGGERWPVPASQFERGHAACPGQPQAAGEEGPGAGPSGPGPASGDQSPGPVTGSPVAGG